MRRADAADCVQGFIAAGQANHQTAGLIPDSRSDRQVSATISRPLPLGRRPWRFAVRSRMLVSRLCRNDRSGVFREPPGAAQSCARDRGRSSRPPEAFAEPIPAFDDLPCDPPLARGPRRRLRERRAGHRLSRGDPGPAATAGLGDRSVGLCDGGQLRRARWARRQRLALRRRARFVAGAVACGLLRQRAGQCGRVWRPDGGRGSLPRLWRRRRQGRRHRAPVGFYSCRFRGRAPGGGRARGARRIRARRQTARVVSHAGRHGGVVRSDGGRLPPRCRAAEPDATGRRRARAPRSRPVGDPVGADLDPAGRRRSRPVGLPAAVVGRLRPLRRRSFPRRPRSPPSRTFPPARACSRSSSFGRFGVMRPPRASRPLWWRTVSSITCFHW